ncbi:MAG: linear amide C-N hydrolase [Ruminococcaceae bacterium]|nr:linear amide C-N hydrolase [Oscillospiraceae bacterium]
MCTGLYMRAGEDEGFLFGRNMDIEVHFGERIVITPRSMPLHFRCLPTVNTHHAIIGMAAVKDGYPLYADAMNEKGLCAAGLHFPGNAVYVPLETSAKDKCRVAPFELIPYLLGYCETVAEVRRLLDKTEIGDIHFSPELPNTPLHWYIVGRDGGLILETVSEGLKIYDDEFGVLTNNPPYPYHRAHMNRYVGLTASVPHFSRASESALGDTYDLGVGMVGLPGDYTSPSRFARAAILRRYADVSGSVDEKVVQTFRILGAVAPPSGCVLTRGGRHHVTRYTACMDPQARTYHVVTDQKITPLSITLTDQRCEGYELWEAHL